MSIFMRYLYRDEYFLRRNMGLLLYGERKYCVSANCTDYASLAIEGT